MNAVLIIGCGETGRRVAGLSRPVQLVAVVRRDTSAARLQALGIETRNVDLDSAFSSADLPADARLIYYFAPPPPRGDSDPRIARVCTFLQPGNLPRKLVYISTTAVYGDCGGAWIDESAPVHPESARGRRRLDAEQQLCSWSGKTGVPVVILRVPAIYGPGHLPLERLRNHLPVLAPEESPFSNRIHVDDLARICVAAMQHGKGGHVYNISDGHPSSMTDYFNRVADKFGLPRPPVVDRATATKQLSASMRAYLSESKRILNGKMLDELHVQLLYPDLDRGLAQCAGDPDGTRAAGSP